MLTQDDGCVRAMLAIIGVDLILEVVPYSWFTTDLRYTSLSVGISDSQPLINVPVYGYTCEVRGRRAAAARARVNPCHLPKNAYSHFLCHPKSNPISVLLASLVLFLSSLHLIYQGLLPSYSSFREQQVAHDIYTAVAQQVGQRNGYTSRSNADM